MIYSTLIIIQMMSVIIILLYVECFTIVAELYIHNILDY